MDQTRLSCGQYDYDLLVIGGGSGGLAVAKRGCWFGRRVLVLDLVAPTPKVTKWGLAGSSVNVGSIPRKLLHQASPLGKAIQDGESWRGSGASVTVHDMYLGHQLQCMICIWGGPITQPAETLVIAVGDRKQYLIIPGDREHLMTCSLCPHSPGRTLVVGGSSEGLECAGFLSGLGLEVTVLVGRYLGSTTKGCRKSRTTCWSTGSSSSITLTKVQWLEFKCYGVKY
uniref:FAD/NAD(P)-binding domain-containing protein n=1 Tax=Oncorhynchus tshawytscha TaxID=74940 RepID=A0AAZ3PD96_ONCTS